MVCRSSPEAFLTDAPSLEQGGVFRIVDHIAETVFGALKRIGSFLHDEEHLHDVLFHVSAGVELRFERLNFCVYLSFREYLRQILSADYKQKVGVF